MVKFTTFIEVGSKQNTTKLGNSVEKSESDDIFAAEFFDALKTTGFSVTDHMQLFRGADK